MILNEDYFKNIELADEDIADNISDELCDTPGYIMSEHNNYECAILIQINKEYSESGKQFIPKLSKALTGMLDIYNIRHSSLYTFGSATKQDAPKNITATRNDLYIHLTDVNFIKFTENCDIYAMMYFDKPAFRTIKQPLMFIQRLADILYSPKRKYKDVFLNTTLSSSFQLFTYPPMFGTLSISRYFYQCGQYSYGYWEYKTWSSTKQVETANILTWFFNWNTANKFIQLNTTDDSIDDLKPEI